MQKIYIFTEFGTDIGYGHIMRCRTLYNAAVELGYDVEFVIKSSNKKNPFLKNINHIFVDWYCEREIDLILGKNNVDYAIIDSYLAPTETFNHIIKFSKKCLLLIDDCSRELRGGVISNPAINSDDTSFYPDHVEKLLGLRYALIRKEFIKNRQTVNERIENILVIMGGTDAKNLTSIVVSQLLSYREDVMLHIVSNDTISGYEKNARCIFYSRLNAYDLSELMFKCDFAFTAAGQTTYELVANKLPFIPIIVANNQLANIEWLTREKIIDKYVSVEEECWEEKLLKYFTDMKRIKERENFLKKCQNLIDAEGPRRVIAKLIG